MPNNVNAKKALRQNLKHRAANRSQTATLRTVVKKVRKLAAEGDAQGASAAYNLAAKKLDQAAAKHLIHKNAAARTKSRLAKAIKGGAAAGGSAKVAKS